MILELAFGTGLVIIAIAFLAEYMDSSLGMGYGTTLSPVLLIIGFEPLEVIPAVLLSELVTGLFAGFAHHYSGNVDFKPKTLNLRRIFGAFGRYGIKESFVMGVPKSLKVAMLFVACSLAGVFVAAVFAINLSAFYLKLFISLIIISIGIFIIFSINRSYKFSWKKVTLIGLIASFNKGLTGGGYGPVVVGGQVVSGISGREAVAITSLAEGLVSLVAVGIYFFSGHVTNWTLAPYLLAGALLSVPLSVYTVKIVKTKNLKIFIGVFSLLLGIFYLIKLAT